MALQKLYLIGFSSDLSMLILSRQRGVKSGGYMVAVDDRLWRTLDEIARLEGEAADASAPADAEPASATPAAAAPEPAAEARPAAVGTELSAEGGATRSRLTPKQIQSELRAGRSVLEVARMAGTEIAWIERFQGPILAEREGIIEAVKSGVLSRPKLGRAGMSVDEAIAANLQERRGPISTHGKNEGWSVARVDGAWEVSFRYSVKGEARDARFSFDADSRTVKALNAVAAQVGWRAEPPAVIEAEVPPESGPNPGAASVARAGQTARGRPGGEPEGDPARPARPSLWGSAVARGGSAAAGQGRGAPGRAPGQGRVPGQPDPRRGGIRATMGDRTIGELSGGRVPLSEAQSPWARPERSPAGGRGADPGRQGGRGGGRPDPDRQRVSPQGAGPSDDRVSFARGSQNPKPRRLLSNADEEEFRAAVARTRATRTGGRGDPQPEERRPEPPPRPPAKKRLPDDWLLEP
ncbi:MAG TPA: septation protein SepH [Actinomycetota bacterium]|nr:septation protein SepH [Actinomycetota bacterium]